MRRLRLRLYVAGGVGGRVGHAESQLVGDFDRLLQ
jgi:hypothetical protein